MGKSGDRRGVSIYDDECRERALVLLRRWPPGSYVLAEKSKEEVADLYFKVERERWLSYVKHDHAIACLRRDEAIKSKLAAVYEELAEALDWDERRLELGDLKAAAELAVKSLFELYKAELRVEGWRTKPSQAVKDGANYLYELSEVGDSYRLEYGSWIHLIDALFSLASEVRLKDRVAYWLAMRLIEEASSYVYGGERAIKWGDYMDYVLDEVASGKEVDEDYDTSLWWICVALKALKDHSKLEDVRRFEAVEPMIFSCAALEGAEVGLDPRSIASYLADLDERVRPRELGLPSFAELYDVVISGPRERRALFWSSLFKEWWEMTDEEREFSKQRLIAELELTRLMLAVVKVLREKRGFAELKLLDSVGDLAANYIERLERL